MKKQLFILLMSFTLVAQGGELKSFHEINTSLMQGKSFNMLIIFDQCSPKIPVNNMAIFTSPAAVMMQNNYLQFANSPLTTNNPGFPNKPIIENTTYKISHDILNHNDQVSIVKRMITLPDYVIANEIKIICKLGTGAKVFN